MSLRRRRSSRAFHMFLLCSILLVWFPGSILSVVVTLDSIEIFKTHEWISTKPTVYFQCKGENKTVLPDVKKAHISYTFKGEESWQPLTEFANTTKCKRCGFYEEDFLKSDEFDEWELCPSDFSNTDGRYNHFKEKELNATFLCLECMPLESSDSNHASGSPSNGRKGMHFALVIIISASVSTIFILGLVAAYKYWQKRKREQEQARFLKLFEEGDDIEDELGLGPLSGII
ncbi:Formin-like protein [Actinidia chinensis var. chinensis]|uniref:Formin-like protein n=1 Tax=Actinidia chinensis var. chinensis TaxID=1590841 RepID=A0A2R6QKG4_ACTCC|nr:Formin-like protein [Actinidia chinensis var. chinensis]